MVLIEKTKKVTEIDVDCFDAILVAGGQGDHRTFHGLAELNAAIADLLTRLNEERPIRRLGVTRRKLLEEIDRPALKALPESPLRVRLVADLPGRGSALGVPMCPAAYSASL
jgi:hypothetical protein